ncbi:MAG: glycosyltransferase [Clostridia bacterium]|nr:glycosyltransferase [Clostridia bacterium]
MYKRDSVEYLEQALRSIYEDQIKKPDEIVVVFDGPLTAELYQVLDAFAADKQDVVHYYPQEKNQGLGEALRIGTEHCHGDYIFRMDSDDVSAPRRFLEQSAYMEAHPEVDVLGTDIAEFVHSVEEDKRVRSCPATHAGIVKMAKRRCPMNHVSVCIKREALLACGGYQEIPLLEDYYLWLRMIVADRKLANLNQPLVFVRNGTDFSQKRGSKLRMQGWSILQDYMVEHKLIGRFQAFMNMVYINGFVYCPACIRRFAYNRFLRG